MAPDTDIRETLRRGAEPEIGVNIIDLGLVYRIEVEGGRVRIAMTMTNPTCPLVDYLKDSVTSAIRQHVPDVVDVDINPEIEPPWDPDMMSDEAISGRASADAASSADGFRCCPSSSHHGLNIRNRPLRRLHEGQESGLGKRLNVMR